MMNYIKQLCFGKWLMPVAMAAMVMAGSVMAAEDLTARALKLYEKHQYGEAERLLRPELSKMSADLQPAASLALGMNYLSSAMLYRELHKTALLIELDYLTKLSQQKAGVNSNYVYLYLGQALLEAGKLAEGGVYLRKFAELTGTHSAFRSHAKIELGIGLLKQGKNADQEWSQLDSKIPEIKAALAGAYALVGAQDRKPVEMADAAMAEKKKLKSSPDERMLRNLLRVYSRTTALEKALDLLKANELKNASWVEDLGASKSIRFYDMSLLDDIAHTHLNAALKYLEQAGRDAKLSSTATYFLADVYLQMGKSDAALRSATSLLAQAKLPNHYRDIAQVNQAIALNMTGRRDEARSTWQSMAEKSGANPSLLAAVMLACAQARADCAKIEELSLAAVEKGEGKKFFKLNAALGKYYLLRKEYTKAVLYMEAGRDKANKNKIETNDPVLLVNLAEAYYRNKKFSENLEIYFELSKQYPAVRQIQEAMQGIYSMEHQSAGDVKIY